MSTLCNEFLEKYAQNPPEIGIKNENGFLMFTHWRVIKIREKLDECMNKMYGDYNERIGGNFEEISMLCHQARNMINILFAQKELFIKCQNYSHITDQMIGNFDQTVRYIQKMEELSQNIQHPRMKDIIDIINNLRGVLFDTNGLYCIFETYKLLYSLKC